MLAQVDELEKELSKAHSTDTARPAGKRAPSKLPRFTRKQIEDMTVRQLKRAFEERGESFDSSWVGRPDEKKLLQGHAVRLRSLCVEAISARFFSDAKHAAVDAAVDAAVHDLEAGRESGRDTQRKDADAKAGEAAYAQQERDREDS